MTSSIKPAHIVVVPFEAWGHVRPLLHLTIQLLALHPNLHITHLLSPLVAVRVAAELASANFTHAQTGSAALARMQLIKVEVPSHASAEGRDQGKGDLVLDMEAKGAAYAQAVTGYFSFLLGGPSSGIAQVINMFEHTKPSGVLFDMFQPFVPTVVHQVTTAMQIPMLPTFAFIPSGPTSIITQLAKEADGGYGPRMLRLIGEGIARGEDPLQIVAPLGMGDTGALRNLPGLPTMTDYEIHPGLGACPPPPQIVLLLLKTCEAAWSPLQTGFVAVNVEEMEIEAKHWLERSMGKPYLSLGFQYSDDIWQGKVPSPAAEDADGVRSIAFLDEMLGLRGPKSVIYVSFGSAWFPFARPDLVHHLLDTLISTSTPFLFAYATELFPVSADLLDKVLHHAATGFFVSHCGGNSMAEAIVARVPIVGMPFGADQGEHSEICHEEVQAGIDLKQVKCFFGTGEKPKVLYDGTELIGTEEAIKAEMVDLWGQLKGDLGASLYAGMGELNKLCRKSCSEGGASRQAMLDFAKYF